MKINFETINKVNIGVLPVREELEGSYKMGNFTIKENVIRWFGGVVIKVKRNKTHA